MPVFIPPAGLTEASFATPVDVISTSTPPAVLCDWIDPRTGDIRSLFSAPSPIVAKVQHAFTVINNSGAAVGDAGHRFPKIRNVTDSTPKDVRDEIERILRPFIDANEIDDVQIIVANADEVPPDAAAAIVNFHDAVFDTQGQIKL